MRPVNFSEFIRENNSIGYVATWHKLNYNIFLHEAPGVNVVKKKTY